MNVSPWRLLGGIFTAAVLVIGALATWVWQRPVGELKTETQQQDYHKPLKRLVFSDFENSDIVILGGAAESTVSVRRELRWHGDKPQQSEVWLGETLRVSHNCRHSSSDSECSIKYFVRVPAGTAVEASASSGAITVTDTTGEIRATTTSGAVQLSNVTGQLTVKTVSGSLRGNGLRSARADTTSTSGAVDLTFAEAPQRVKVETTSGEASLRVPPSSYRISVATTSGDRNVSVPNDATATRSLTVKSTSGDVVLSTT